MLLGENVDGEDEVELLECLDRPRRHWDRIQEVDAVDDQAGDPVGIVGDHRVDQLLHRGRPSEERLAGTVGASLAGRSEGQFVTHLFTRFCGTAARAARDRKRRMWVGIEER